MCVLPGADPPTGARVAQTGARMIVSPAPGIEAVMRTTLLTLGAVTLSACCVGPDDWGPPEPPSAPCGCSADLAIPATGEVTLKPYVSDDAYLGSVVSFEWASTDVAVTNNDWDVSLTPSTRGLGTTFRVNTVTDDESCLEDLGAIAIADVPAQVTAACGDFVDVVEGHVYLVRTVDSDTRQYAAFGVIAHVPGHEATLRWFRSPEQDAFVLDF
jgi:hypothetical protein